MLPRSYRAYSRRLQVCVESLTRPEREEDLLLLTLRSSGSWIAACRVGDDVRLRLGLHALRNTSSHLSSGGGCADREREDFDDEEDALAARRPALFRPSSPWTSISIHRGQAPS